MYPVFYINSIPFPTYGTLIFIAYIFGIFLAMHLAHIYGYPKKSIFTASVNAAVGMFVWAKIFYFFSILPSIKNFNLFVSSPDKAFYYALSGYVFYGGLFGALLMIFLYCFRHDYDFLHFINPIIPVIPFIHGIGRIGCFMGGCCYGIPYNGFFKITFPPNNYIDNLSDISRFPVQLLEAFALLALFVILYKNAFLKLPDGLLPGLYLMAYGIIRFFIEFLRDDTNRGIFFHLSTSQWLSLLIIPIGFYLLLQLKRNQPD